MSGRHAAPGGRGERQEPLYDVDVPTPTHAERARTLAASVGTGTLSTAAADLGGHPYGSFVTYGLTKDGSPVLLVSALAEHTRNLRADPRASLLVAEPGDGDPLARARVTLVGLAAPAGDDGGESREAFLAAHPNASYYADFRDFGFWRISVTACRYIGGYGRMSWVEAADFARAEPDPLAPHSKRILDHMNADHAEAMALLCRAFSRAVDATDVRMTGVDRYGFEMSVRTGHGPRPVRLAFPAEVATPDAARRALVSLVAKARESLGIGAGGDP